MKLTVYRQGKVYIEDFAERNSLEMGVYERDYNVSLPKYYASFKSTEIKNCNILEGAFGNGETITEAIEAYAKKISKTLIVVDAFKTNQREIIVPNLCVRERYD